MNEREGTDFESTQPVVIGSRGRCSPSPLNLTLHARDISLRKPAHSCTLNKPHS